MSKRRTTRKENYEKRKKKSRAKRHARKVDKRLAQLFKEPHPPILLRPPFFIIHT